MNALTTEYALAEDVRKTKTGRFYTVISFSPNVLINHQKTWRIQYHDNDAIFYKPEVDILENELLLVKPWDEI